ncbi:MAG: alanine--glyoxylate aminotransferase family protein [Bacteroidales bacterium]|nr:alanine--glyoxylate aminotransferase family protein [Bacteroidales bacterium]
MQSFVFPGNIDGAIMKIGSQPFMYMRTDKFSEINKESEQILLDLIHCKDGRTIIYTGSGTGAMSAVVENYCTTKKKAFVIDGGSFGHRWFQLCEYYNVPVVDYTVAFAKDIDYEDLERNVAAEKPDVFLCQHHETSSGQLFNLHAISQICHKYNVSLVVDVISTFLAEELDMDELGIDICITSTQKGLNIPPGLSILFFSKQLNDYKFNHRGYYWDFDDNFNNLKRGQTPYSPATILYLQLHARLKQLQAEGGEFMNIENVRHRALYFRKLCQKYKWKVPAENPSMAITGFQTMDSAERFVFKGLIEKYDTYIMPSAVMGFYRVSHMGLQTDEELDMLAKRIHEMELI